MSTILSTVNLRVGYADRKSTKTLLSDLNLSLPKGSLTVLIGANGTGKSTLLRTLAGAQRPLDGHIELMGNDVAHISIAEKARLLALVYTDRTGAGGLTAAELVGLGRQPYTGFLGRLDADDRRIVDESLAAVGLAHKANDYIATLSDGERQKAMIARALAQATPLIVLDEPTSFLDAASRLEIMHLLRELSEKQDITILLSTHDTASALQIASRLWVIDSTVHTIIEGTPDALIDAGVMDKVFTGRQVRFDSSMLDYRIY